MKQMSTPLRLTLSAVVLSAGIALMLLGILRGEPESILRKAVFVCLECIGIG